MIRTIVFDFGNVLGFFDYGRTTERLARHSHLSGGDIRSFIYGGELEDAYESGRISSADFLRADPSGLRPDLHRGGAEPKPSRICSGRTRRFAPWCRD